MEELLLARAEFVGAVDLVAVGCVSFENHEFLVVKNEIRTFIEGGEDGECLGKLLRVTARLGIALRGGLAEFVIA